MPLLSGIKSFFRGEVLDGLVSRGGGLSREFDRRLLGDDGSFAAITEIGSKSDSLSYKKSADVFETLLLRLGLLACCDGLGAEEPREVNDDSLVCFSLRGVCCELGEHNVVVFGKLSPLTSV